jgi:hypothetical protein
MFQEVPDAFRVNTGRWQLVKKTGPGTSAVLLDYGMLLSNGIPSMYRVDYLAAYVSVGLFGWLP